MEEKNLNQATNKCVVTSNDSNEKDEIAKIIISGDKKNIEVTLTNKDTEPNFDKRESGVVKDLITDISGLLSDD